MNRRTRRTIFNLSVLASSLLCAFAVPPVIPTRIAAALAATAAAEKAIKKDDARKLIAAVSIFELNKEAVTIREIPPAGGASPVTVLASVKLGIRFMKDEAGIWRAADVRTGDRQWESFELLGRAIGRENMTPVRAELDALAAELDALVKANALAKSKGKAGSDASPESQTANKAEKPKELKRGALTVKDPAAAFAPTGSSAVVEVAVEMSVDFVRDARGRWQVARMRVGSGGGQGFEAFDAFERALNAEKLSRARRDLETLAAALESYRRARGSYVVADSASVLVDHLNPRHTPAFIRFDPWHHPYEYEGTRERFTLRSLGADGKANTPDDVTIGK
jgi:hypothetical protein